MTHVGLEHFHERFALAPTIGKLANIVSEVPAGRGLAEDILKAVTSGDRIQVEFKYQQSTEAKPTVRLIFAANETPQFADRSSAIWRRVLILPFDVVIPDDRQDRELAEKICAGELPGIFNWAIDGLRRLRREDNFTVPKSTTAAVGEHRRASNPAREFLEDECVAGPNFEIATRKLHLRYEMWRLNRGGEPLNEQQFGKEVRRVYSDVQRVQRRTKGGGRQYFYIGVKVPERPLLRKLKK